MIASAFNVQGSEVEAPLARLSKKKVSDGINGINIHLLGNLTSQPVENRLDTNLDDFFPIEKGILEWKVPCGCWVSIFSEPREDWRKHAMAETKGGC